MSHTHTSNYTAPLLFHQYKLKEVQDYPTGPIFWVEGYSGDFIATVLVFEPIPSRVSTITYIEPEGEPFNMWGASWKGEVKPNLDVNSVPASRFSSTTRESLWNKGPKGKGWQIQSTTPTTFYKLRQLNIPRKGMGRSDAFRAFISILLISCCIAV